ncbi:glycosyl transferase [uncultured Helicobacter sp.]|uniref:glycosyl transferase n=1 Tax=uncultured Helicobacter sp. TaxID=175537 RepID=UPI00374EDF34
MREAFSLIDSDLYVMIDADTQYDTHILPQAIEHCIKHSLDMLNIARIPTHKNTHRKGHSFGNKLLTRLASALFGRKLEDMLSGYRIFSKAFVKSFPAHSQGFEIETELTIFALQQRLRIDEIAAPYKARPDNSFSKLSTFKDGFKILGMILQLLITERPMFVFGIVSLLCLVLGVGLSLPIVLEFLQTSQVARFPTLFVCVGLLVSSVVLGGIGFLAHLVAKGIREQRHLTFLSYHKE